MQNIYKKVRFFQYVSFDIFDTLLIRGVDAPVEVFDFVEELYNEENKDKIYSFKQKRIRAEKKARKKALKEDILLKDIYFYMPFKQSVKERLIELECYVEISNCYPNDVILDLYHQCIAEKQFVIITSDMYLPRNVIEKILYRLGIREYKKLYISSEIGLTKRSGKLFDYILDDLRIFGKELIHIGDNTEIDGNNARKRGIETYIVEKYSTVDGYWKKEKNILLKHMVSCTNSVDVRKREVPYILGYKLVGPFLYQFNMWLHNESEKHKFSKIVFMAREGYLPYLLYKEMYPEESEKICYLRINRNTLRLPVLSQNKPLNNFILYNQDYKEYTIKQICEMLILDIQKSLVKELLEKYHYKPETPVTVQEMRQSKRFSDFYSECIKIAEKEIEKQKLFLEKYIEQCQTEGKVALVNNSMHGSAQTYLTQLFPEKDFWGVHFILTETGKKRVCNKCSIWFSERGNQFKKKVFCRNSLVFEHLLFEDCGTAKVYEERNGKILAICENQGVEKKNKDVMQKIRNGAVDFSKMYQNVLPKSIAGNMCLKAMSRFLCYPKLDDAIAIGKLYDSDYDGLGQLAVLYRNNKVRALSFFHTTKASWKQGLLVIANKQICLQIYNIYLYFKTKEEDKFV